MYKRDEELYELCFDLVAGMGFQLVSVEDVVDHGRRAFRFYIDRPNGIVVEDCVSVSKEIEYLLDAELDFDGAFVLEVSSPGLDHRLSQEREYAHFKGKRARLVLREPDDGRNVVVGVIAGAGAGAVRIVPDDGPEVTVSLENVVRARLMI
ncbi:MAG: ribosome maturation factor RimP [Candidatus Eisenbacteria bacterium]